MNFYETYQSEVVPMLEQGIYSEQPISKYLDTNATNMSHDFVEAAVGQLLRPRALMVTHVVKSSDVVIMDGDKFTEINPFDDRLSYVTNPEYFIRTDFFETDNDPDNPSNRLAAFYISLGQEAMKNIDSEVELRGRVEVELNLREKSEATDTTDQSSHGDNFRYRHELLDLSLSDWTLDELEYEMSHSQGTSVKAMIVPNINHPIFQEREESRTTAKIEEYIRKNGRQLSELETNSISGGEHYVSRDIVGSIVYSSIDLPGSARGIINFPTYVHLRNPEDLLQVLKAILPVTKN